jgi:hypothetical protein
MYLYPYDSEDALNSEPITNKTYSYQFEYLSIVYCLLA